MGMNVGGSEGGPKSDINVTPLVDVVLVLLIIFLVTMPIMMRQISIEVPRKINEETEVIAAPSEQIQIEVKADNTVLLIIGNAEEETTIAQLPAKLRPALEKKSGEKAVFVDFDFAIPYGTAVQVMDTIAGSGAEKVALVDKSAKRPSAGSE